MMKSNAALPAAWAISIYLITSPQCVAQDAETERLARACNKIYAGLCKDVARGPEMLGECFTKHPGIADKIPEKCQADFQTNIENYNEAKSQRGK